MMHSPHLQLAKKFWIEHLQTKDVVVDATCGNGQDTLFLCRLGCIVHAIDIQMEAIERTKILIETEGLSKQITLYCQCHSQFPKLPSLPKLIVYNLGYLPRTNKQLTTQTETTILSLRAALELVDPDQGAISIICYPGHTGGDREEKSVLEFVSKLSFDEWQVCQHRWINRDRAPSFLWLSRTKRIENRFVYP